MAGSVSLISSILSHPKECLKNIYQKSPIQLDTSSPTPAIRVRFTPELSKFLGIFGLSYTYFNIIVVALASLFITIPGVYTDDQENARMATWTMYFLIANVVANLALVAKERSFYDERNVSTQPHISLLPDSSWSHCPTCNQQTPPRAHHCVLCRRCVLKRDHHCFFVGACVGFYNQRYFFFFCLYASLGAAFGMFFATKYLRMVYLDPFSGNFWHFGPPIATIEWLYLGYIDFNTLCLVIYFNLCSMTTIGAGGFAVIQIYLIFRGLTLHEYQEGINVHPSGIADKFRSVFGPYWLLNFIFPIPCLKTVGDGITWNDASKLK